MSIILPFSYKELPSSYNPSPAVQKPASPPSHPSQKKEINLGTEIVPFNSSQAAPAVQPAQPPQSQARNANVDEMYIAQENAVVGRIAQVFFGEANVADDVDEFNF